MIKIDMILLILEAIFVGFFTFFISLFISLKQLYIQLFIIGYLKHIIGYYINLHYYYCNYGYSCDNKNYSKKVINKYLLFDSIYDGIIFIIFGYLLLNIYKNKFLFYFLLGFIVHIISEYFLFHKFFCNKRCL